jgi:hypothetical protein
MHRDHDRDRIPIRINRDPILIGEQDPGSSGKIDLWVVSPEQKFLNVL